MVLGNSYEAHQFLSYLGKDRCVVYSPEDPCIYKDQSQFEHLYSERPEYLSNLKIKIPYSYSIQGENYRNENEYRTFAKIYSEWAGAGAVFVSEKTLNLYANWLGLSTYWSNSGVDTLSNFYKKRRFATPQIHLGYIHEGNDEDWEIIKHAIYSKRANWVFHLTVPESFKIFKTPDVHYYSFESKEAFYNNIQVILVPSQEQKGMRKSFPSQSALEAMSKGCVLIAGNTNHNNVHFIFDKVHYFRLDFVDGNSLVETIRYAEKRREKLERMSFLGSNVVKKYFDVRDVVEQKLKTIEFCR